MYSEGRRRVFVDVDTQFDFMAPDGRLYVPGAEGLASNLQALTAQARERRIPVIATADQHPDDDPEFDEFGSHCVRGTPGAERIDATRRAEAPMVEPDTPAEQAARRLAEAGVVVVTKREIDVFSNPNLGVLVDSAGPDAEFVVYGVATEYCVRTAVEGLLARARRVTLVSDAIAGLGEQAAQETLDALVTAGARLATTAEILAEPD